MQGPTVICDECNETIPPGAKFRQTEVEFVHQKIRSIVIRMNLSVDQKEVKQFDLCGDRCLLKHISRLLNQGV